MADRVSALDGHVAPRRLGPKDGPAGVRLSELRLHGLWQIAAWPDRLGAAGRAAAGAAGVPEAPGPGESAAGIRGTLLRTEPLKCLLASRDPLPRPEIAPGDGTALDLSHARTLVRLEGPAAPDLMARLVALDLRPGAFPDGRVATAPIHHVAVTIHARAGGLDLYLPRSFALALWEHMAETGAQFGLEIG
jgi:sarcosine oxidase gamma subunit